MSILLQPVGGKNPGLGCWSHNLANDKLRTKAPLSSIPRAVANAFPTRYLKLSPFGLPS